MFVGYIYKSGYYVYNRQVQQLQVVTLTTLTAGVTEYFNAQKEPGYDRPQVYDQSMKRKPVSFYHGHHWRNSVDCLKNVFIWGLSRFEMTLKSRQETNCSTPIL